MTPYHERRKAGFYAPKPEPRKAAPKPQAQKRGKAKRDA